MGFWKVCNELFCSKIKGIPIILSCNLIIMIVMGGILFSFLYVPGGGKQLFFPTCSYSSLGGRWPRGDRWGCHILWPSLGSPLDMTQALPQLRPLPCWSLFLEHAFSIHRTRPPPSLHLNVAFSARPTRAILLKITYCSHPPSPISLSSAVLFSITLYPNIYNLLYLLLIACLTHQLEYKFFMCLVHRCSFQMPETNLFNKWTNEWMGSDTFLYLFYFLPFLFANQPIYWVLCVFFNVFFFVKPC